MFETTIAGSLPKPGWLAETDKLWPAWRAEGAELDKAKRDATLLWLKEQEDAAKAVLAGLALYIYRKRKYRVRSLIGTLVVSTPQPRKLDMTSERALQQRIGITAVYVTHDREEALTLALKKPATAPARAPRDRPRRA